ncbi:hypothetical protein ACRAWF_06190 [Streptomyces sp. L7]
MFVLHLYQSAILNRAALEAVGFTRDSPNPPGGEIVRDFAEATPPASCSPPPPPDCSTRPLPRARSSPPRTNSAPPATTCAN